MPLCTICKKRPAVIFATDSAHPEKTKGYCFTCARKIGLPNIENMISRSKGDYAYSIFEITGELPGSAVERYL